MRWSRSGSGSASGSCGTAGSSCSGGCGDRAWRKGHGGGRSGRRSSCGGTDTAGGGSRKPAWRCPRLLARWIGFLVLLRPRWATAECAVSPAEAGEAAAESLKSIRLASSWSWDNPSPGAGLIPWALRLDRRDWYSDCDEARRVLLRWEEGDGATSSRSSPLGSRYERGSLDSSSDMIRRARKIRRQQRYEWTTRCEYDYDARFCWMTAGWR